MRRALTLLALVAFWTNGSACEPMLDADIASCWSNDDCTNQTVCSFNHCVSNQPNTLKVAAKIIPVPSSGHVMQQIPDLDLNAGHAVDVTLLEPVEIVGTVTLKGHGFASYNVPGTLEARSAGEIAGHDYRFTTRSLEGLNEEGFGYALRVLPSREYAMKFKPDDPSIPVHTWLQTVSSQTKEQHDIVLPADHYVSVAGFVRFSAVEVVPNARITAILPDGMVASSVLTDPIKGFFELQLPPASSHVSFRVKAGDEETVFPEHTTEEFEVGADLALWITKPDDDPVPVSLRLSATGASGASEVVAETTVTIATEAGKLRQTVTTDAYGVAVFEALPGDYHVAICPNPSSSHASYIGNITLNASQASPEIALEERVSFHGKVLKHDGRSLASGSLMLTRHLPEADAKAALVTPSPFSVNIEDDGSFASKVDPGRYTVRVSPGPGSDAPPFNILDVDIEWDEELTIQLPALDLVHLTVLNAKGEPLPAVSVELYAIQAAEGAVQLLSVTSTGFSGGANLLVPLLD
jgi:hypothetical protein